jgi:hypothetical protein
MILEGLVIFSCSAGSGCSESLSNYYEKTPEAREIYKNVNNELMKHDAIKSLVPVVAMLNGNININKNVNLKIKQDQILLTVEFK